MQQVIYFLYLHARWGLNGDTSKYISPQTSKEIPLTDHGIFGKPFPKGAECRQLCCEREGLWTFSYSWKGHLTAKHWYLSEIAFMANPSLFSILNFQMAEVLGVWAITLLYASQKVIVFWPFFPEFSWPAPGLATWQHVVESREMWQGELDRLHWELVDRPAGFHPWENLLKSALVWKGFVSVISIKAAKVGYLRPFCGPNDLELHTSVQRGWHN